MSSLANRVALVTGGGTGIGRAIALAPAEHGAQVVVNYSRSGDDAEANVSGSSIAYAASKGSVGTMTGSLARALAPNIIVNTTAPGLTATRWHAGREAENAKRAQSSPVRRVGRPEDIAHIALALATSDNFLTGQVIVIDGGAPL